MSYGLNMVILTLFFFPPLTKYGDFGAIFAKNIYPLYKSQTHFFGVTKVVNFRPKQKQWGFHFWNSK
jgi:hypothetical protein